MRRPIGVTIIALALIAYSAGGISVAVWLTARNLWSPEQFSFHIGRSIIVAFGLIAVLLMAVPGWIGVALWHLENSARRAVIFFSCLLWAPWLILIDEMLPTSEAGNAFFVAVLLCCALVIIYLLMPNVNRAFQEKLTTINLDRG